MVDRWRSLPTPVLCLLIWLAATPLAFGAGAFAGVSWLWTAVTAVVFGLAVAVALTFGLRTRWRIQDKALGDASPALRRPALRAAWSGPVPADPEIRSAALRIAEHQLRQVRRTRPIMLIGLALMLVSVVGNAIIDPWKLLFSLCYVPLIVVFAMTPGRLRRRIVLLSDNATAAEESSAAVPTD
ncbi:hypothetical protein AB0P21_27160 [Kribbella sp. NPDC056861]|uniref:hypothetical protein n=1 Tax=Kribbella sp. NPDC056861 TaxID=3154857 RepID=UPI00341A232E